MPSEVTIARRAELLDLMVAAGKDNDRLESDISSLPEAVLDDLITYYGSPIHVG
jgi:hypothetical protein